MCFNPSATEPKNKKCPECGLKQAFKNRTCTECGFEFPLQEKKRRQRDCPECGLKQPFTNRTCSQCGFTFPKAKGLGDRAKKPIGGNASAGPSGSR